MAEGMLGGILGNEDEKREVEAPDALAGAEAFASAVAAKLAGNDPEVARKTVEFLGKPERAGHPPHRRRLYQTGSRSSLRPDGAAGRDRRSEERLQPQPATLHRQRDAHFSWQEKTPRVSHHFQPKHLGKSGAAKTISSARKRISRMAISSLAIVSVFKGAPALDFAASFKCHLKASSVAEGSCRSALSRDS